MALPMPRRAMTMEELVAHGDFVFNPPKDKAFSGVASPLNEDQSSSKLPASIEEQRSAAQALLREKDTVASWTALKDEPASNGDAPSANGSVSDAGTLHRTRSLTNISPTPTGPATASSAHEDWNEAWSWNASAVPFKPPGNVDCDSGNANHMGQSTSIPGRTCSNNTPLSSSLAAAGSQTLQQGQTHSVEPWLAADGLTSTVVTHVDRIRSQADSMKANNQTAYECQMRTRFEICNLLSEIQKLHSALGEQQSRNDAPDASALSGLQDLGSAMPTILPSSNNMNDLYGSDGHCAIGMASAMNQMNDAIANFQAFRKGAVTTDAISKRPTANHGWRARNILYEIRRGIDVHLHRHDDQQQGSTDELIHHLLMILKAFYA